MQDQRVAAVLHEGHHALHGGLGLGALVAGKVAAKVGFFKLLLGAALAAKKLVFAVAVGALIGKLLKGRKD
jgi:hypothetical protein